MAIKIVGNESNVIIDKIFYKNILLLDGEDLKSFKQLTEIFNWIKHKNIPAEVEIATKLSIRNMLEKIFVNFLSYNGSDNIDSILIDNNSFLGEFHFKEQSIIKGGFNRHFDLITLKINTTIYPVFDKGIFQEDKAGIDMLLRILLHKDLDHEKEIQPKFLDNLTKLFTCLFMFSENKKDNSLKLSEIGNNKFMISDISKVANFRNTLSNLARMFFKHQEILNNLCDIITLLNNQNILLGDICNNLDM